MKFTLVIADDNTIITDGLKELISEYFQEIEITGIYRNGKDLIDDIDTHSIETPDIFLSDIHMPKADGIDVCRYLKEHNANTQMILFTGYKKFEYAKDALNLQVSHLLVKPYSSEELLECIRKVLAVIKAEQTPAQAETLSYNPDSIPALSLTPLIEKYIAKHYTNAVLSVPDIAAHFGISNSYLSRMFKREKDCALTTYISNVRIQKAKELIQKNPLISNKNIADQIGFNDPIYFHKVFKKTLGVTPAQYRRMVQSDEKTDI